MSMQHTVYVSIEIMPTVRQGVLFLKDYCKLKQALTAPGHLLRIFVRMSLR